MFVNMKEGETERFPFIFDIRNFENRLEETLFVGGKVFTEDEALDVIYSSYLDSIGGSISKEHSPNQNRYFADTLPNGVEPIKMVAENVSNAKIVIVNRNLVSLLFANAIRMQSYNSEFLIDTRFRKILFNQERFTVKMRQFHQDIKKLQATYENVMLIDFDKLILDTDTTMREISDFIGVEYEEILAQPSLNGEPIDSKKFPMIGKVNDDPYLHLAKSDIAVLRHVANGYDTGLSILTNVPILLRVAQWRLINRINKVLKFVAEWLLPRRFIDQLKVTFKTH